MCSFLHLLTRAHCARCSPLIPLWLHTCIISTQEEWRQPGTGAWLRGAEERLLLGTKALHTQKKAKKDCQEKTDIHESKTGFEHTELEAKLLDYFLQSNKSNFNQSTSPSFHFCTFSGRSVEAVQQVLFLSLSRLFSDHTL